MSLITSSNPNAGTITVTNPDGSITIIPGTPLTPYHAYPGFQTQYTKENFSYKNLDNTVTNETDGGYEYGRPRNGNFYRRDYNLGYALMPDSEKRTFEEFIRTVGNTAGIFTWIDPTTIEQFLCRFSEVPNIVYAGFGSDVTGFLWNITFRLRTIRLIQTTTASLLIDRTTGKIYQICTNYNDVVAYESAGPAVDHITLFDTDSGSPDVYYDIWVDNGAVSIGLSTSTTGLPSVILGPDTVTGVRSTMTVRDGFLGIS